MPNNLKIASNAVYLYMRMIINMIVSIFSVRIMMEALGIEDYGLQAVAGGVLGLFSVIISGMSTSTSRFITYELGRGDREKLNETFCTAMLVYIGMALTMAILGETVGLWILTHKLNIPEGRETAAMVVYQLSIFGSLVGIPQGPYNAVMIAHEKFNVSAYLSLFNSFARLGVLYWVAQSSLDHLILYQVSMAVLGLGSLIYSRVYCIRHFPEVRFRILFNRGIFRPMLTFSLWETFGAISRTLKGSGYQMVLNIFHGVRLNAAIGIGSTVSGAVTGLAFTVTSAFKPAIVKLFAGNDIDGMKESIHNATLISMVLYGIFGIPLMVELDFVMNQWLNEIPPLSRELCMIQLVLNTIIMGYLVCAESLKSMGRNRGVNLMQCCDGIISMLAVLSFLLLDLPPLWACGAFELGLISNFVVTMVLLSRAVGYKYVLHLLDRAVFRVILAEVAIYLILSLVHDMLGSSWGTLILVCFLSVVLFSVVTFYWLLEPHHNAQLRLYLSSRFSALRLQND